ncbi:MAG: ATP-binding protein [Candidatus Aenigmatarchaeota archaeon]
MSKIIGTVISNIDGPSTFKFDFVIKDDSRKIPVRKGQFVQVNTEEGIIVGRVDEIIKTNRYFMHAESVREFEKTGRALNEIFPVERWEYLLAKVIPLGIYDSGLLKRVSFPPSPGSTVEEIDKKILSEFLGFDVNGLNIGKINFHDLDAKINLTRIFQKHLAILAISGAGKSYLTSVLLEELLERSEELGKPSVVLIDTHGEYVGFASDPKYGKYTKVYGKGDISIAVSDLSPNQIMEFLPQISPAQRRELTTIIENLAKKKKNYNFKDLITEVEVSNAKRVVKDTIISWLMNLEKSHLFKNYTKPNPADLGKSGQLSIIDVSDIINQQDKQMIVAFFARKLFWLRREGRIPPSILILEEAHNFCPEGVKKEGALSRKIIETIAREGRKFHISLVLISQRPIQLSTTVLSQCNTHIIMRVTNPYDLDHIGKSAEGITSDVLKMIPGLRTGEALIVGEAVNFPILIKVRTRNSKKSEKGISLEEALLKYNKSIRLREDDMKAFM